jgi:hypothetical protein
MLLRSLIVTVFTLTLGTQAQAGVIDIDFNPGSGQNFDFYGNSSGDLFFTGTDGFQVIFTDDNSNGAAGGDANGVRITNQNHGNIKVGSSTDFVLGANNTFISGGNYHSSGIIATFNQGATLVSFDDTDNDGTLKALFAFDEFGALIGQSAFASQVPVIVDTTMTGGALIYSVEFDTAPGTAGGSNDGTVFTIDNFHVEGVSPDNSIGQLFPVPAPGALALLGMGLIGLGWRRRTV